MEVVYFPWALLGPNKDLMQSVQRPTADTSTAFIEVSQSILVSFNSTFSASKPSGTDSIVVAKLSEGDSGSLKVKILVPVAVLILLAIVIASWRYCDRGNTNQNNNTEMADVTPMMSKTATGPGAAEAEEGLLSEEV